MFRRALVGSSLGARLSGAAWRSVPSARGLAAEAALAEAPVAGAAAATAHAAAARAAAPRQPPTLEQLVEFRENVAAFTQSYVKPRAAEIDRLGGLPPGFDFWTKAGDWGLHGITVPIAQGGLGLGRLHHAIAMEEMCRASGAVGASWGVHTAVVISQLVHHGTRQQLDKFLPQLVSGEHVGALAVSEPSAGSDAASMRCRADKRDGCYVLNGGKMGVTNGAIADTFIVYAQTATDEGTHGITALLVERGMKGFCAGPELGRLGLRGSGACELRFDDCEVPAENVLGGENQGMHVLMSGLDLERLVLAAGPVGLMQAALDAVLPCAQEGTMFGQGSGAKLADIYTAVQASRAYIHSVGLAVDAGHISCADCAALMLFGAEKATQVALSAMQLLGGNSKANDRHPVGRLLRDARLYEIAAGTSEIRRLLSGRELVQESVR